MIANSLNFIKTAIYFLIINELFKTYKYCLKYHKKAIMLFLSLVTYVFSSDDCTYERERFECKNMQQLIVNSILPTNYVN